jgi:hypothetical protein
MLQCSRQTTPRNADLRFLPASQARRAGRGSSFRALTAHLTYSVLSRKLERAKGFEPSTPTLARLCSTPELRPLWRVGNDGVETTAGDRGGQLPSVRGSGKRYFGGWQSARPRPISARQVCGKRMDDGGDAGAECG